MKNKYYEMEVLIKGIIRVPVVEYDNKEIAKECIEMSDDITEIAYNIQENNDQPFFISVRSIKEIDY